MVLNSCGQSKRLRFLGISSVSNRLAANDLRFAHSVHLQTHRCDALRPALVAHDYPVTRASRFITERKRKGPRLHCAANRISIRWNSLNPSVTALKKKTFAKRIADLIDSGTLTF